MSGSALTFYDDTTHTSILDQIRNHFVDSSVAADLSAEEQAIIQDATATINNWNVLCDQGVSIAMANHPDIQYIQNANADLKNTTGAQQTNSRIN